MKKFFSKEITIALVTIISLIALYVGVNHLKGVNIFKPSNMYYVKMPNVSELQTSSPVYVDGFKVGLVSSIEFPYTNQEDILVVISLDKKMKIPMDSHFELATSLTSGAYLNLVMNRYVSKYYNIGDTIIGNASPGLMDKVANDILPGVEKLLPHLDSILYGIKLLVNNPALTTSMENLALTTSNLEKSTQRFESMVNNQLPQILDNMNQLSGDLTQISGQLKQIDLTATMGKVDATLQNLDQFSRQLNETDNSLGLLMNDKSLYNNLDSTAVNASLLLRDLRENPKRYVHFSLFGRK
ncbi:MAG: MlaD family protein [Dysgonamonadaceae bacterium]|jgi:phospholipid/cholesterol/gamma-HCH transport system substrate-binding protein|nr:MlaD family protein [Dysgonamonadaceae bacterium]